MFTKSVIATLLSVGILASGAHAGLFGYAFNKMGDSNSSSGSNPCKSETFNKKYGQYCSGMFTKSIRCLSDGSNPGVCDSAAVCDTLDRTAKNLCETHCLNTAPQKMGNQSIKISCAPNPTAQKNIKRINLTNPSQDEKIQSQNQPQPNDISAIDSKISVDPLMQVRKNSEMEMDARSIRGKGISENTMRIRGPNEGSQDSQTAEANIYQTEHPKSFDQINTEQPWTTTPDLPFAVEGGLGNGTRPHHYKHHSVTVGGTLSRRPESADSENLSIEEGAEISTYPLDEVDQPSAFQPSEFEGEFSSSELVNNIPSDDVQGSAINAETFPADLKGHTGAAYQNLRNYHFYSMPD